MAEVAIPLAALGVMYILSNNKEPVPIQEGFNTELPNVNKPPNNFPVEDFKDVKHSVSKYAGKKTGVEEFFKKENYQQMNRQRSDNTSFTSLTGNVINKNSIEHDNMVPFFGSNVSQPNLNQENSTLNLYTGMGEEHIKKREQAPLFKPNKNLNYINGAPNVNNFIQERMQSNITDKQNNVKPWQEIQVGPGLNKGYSSEGVGGFNSGMDAREKMLPKNVDQLRAKTNPKVTYGTQTLGAYVGKGHASSADVKHLGVIEKNRPDTYFINTPDRWLTTTGASGEAQTNRSTVMLKATNNIQTEHFGGGNSNANGVYQSGHYNPAQKQQLKGPQVGGASASGKNIQGDKKDQYENLPNSRSLTGDQNQWGAAYGGYMNAIVAPILDLIRPTRKENVIGNMRPVGNPNNGSWGVKNGTIWKPNDALKTTIKEQYIDNDRVSMGFHNHSGGYTTNPKQKTYQQRDTTNSQYIPNGGVQTQVQTYNSAYNAHLNPNKEVLTKRNFHKHGNQKLFTGNINVTNLKNKATNSSRGLANMPKQSANMSTIGYMSGRNNRETRINNSRNNSGMTSQFQNNPYTHSLHSVA